MADKRISQLIERTDIANNDVLPIVASGATTTNKVTISTIQTWMQDNLDVGVTSVGLSMPSAFVVSNSPVTASGNITVTGAGTVSQYIRGDGSLADFPQSGGGGGASVNYYLNGSVSQGTIGGIAYLEMNKTPILGAGTDFTIAADGYIASFITDAGDPGLLEIPAGNWNFETYLSASSGGGSPTFYIELYKVNSGGTASLIASNSATPESISLGTNINPYFSALAVPTTTLALTDRLALRYYVTHAGRTITLHTENSHLCQIITTFTTGLTALNGLTAQVQNFATGTSGTDFNISSAGSTHTFNIPSASGNASRGLITNATQTIAGSKTFLDDGVFNDVNIGRGAGNFTSNTRVGLTALQFNTTGQQNTAVGTQVLLLNTEGGFNTGLGYNALLRNTTGGSNTAVGAQTLKENTIGTHNTAVGVFALIGNTTAAANTAIGYTSLYSNTTGNYNTGVGSETLFQNTTGFNNTAAGRVALRDNTTGANNAAFGNLSLYLNTTGSQNTGIGYSALGGNTTGTNNVAVGHIAGNLINSGTNNETSNNSVYIGHDARGSASGNTNEIVIGAGARGNGSNTVTLGNDSITTTFLKGNISLKGENSAVKSIQYTNPSGTLHWSVQTSFGAAGQHQPFSIRNGVLGTDAILIQPASNNITFNNSITNFLGSLSGTSASFSDVVTISKNQTSNTNTLVISNPSTTGAFAASGMTLQSYNGTSTVDVLTLSATSNTWNYQAYGANSGIIYSGGTGGLKLFAGNGSGSIRFYTAGDGTGNERLTISSTGAATFSSSVTATNATINNSVGNDLLYLDAGINTDYAFKITSGADDMLTLRRQHATQGNRDIISFGFSGNVGIGTTSPGDRLVVNGNLGVTDGSFAAGESYSLYLGDKNAFVNSTFGQRLRFGAFNGFDFGFAQNNDLSLSSTWMSINSLGEVLVNSNTATYSATNRGNITLSGATSALIGLRAAGANRGYLFHDTGEFQIVSDSSSELSLFSNSRVNAGVDNTYSMGASGRRWAAIWAANGTIQTSDERQKKDIKPTNLGLDFITKLKPVSYKWKIGGNIVEQSESEDENEVVKRTIIPTEGKRTHYGLIAQEVKEVLGDIDFGGFVHDQETDTMALRYDQFIAPLIKAVQEQQEQIKSLTEQVEALKSQING